MNRKLQTQIGLAIAVVGLVNEFRMIGERQRAHRRAIEELERTRRRLQQFQVDLEFEKIIERY